MKRFGKLEIKNAFAKGKLVQIAGQPSSFKVDPNTEFSPELIKQLNILVDGKIIGSAVIGKVNLVRVEKSKFGLHTWDEPSKGQTCCKCKEFYPYAEINKDDGTFKCYACRKGL